MGFLDIVARAALIYLAAALVLSILAIRPWSWTRDTRQAFWALFDWRKS
ncbi:hypothetical protein CcrKarma_gp179 [Caulobacter virus Karma]|uniref:Uncharacterized protein n=6 Tax=Viruses TaxID=10239 RepID=K4JP53_9CAUD|nr:hypothetical protein D865_gp241 [Caulobacter phage phiCbK]YP_006988857.1 hypothetical protein CcrMagneto_gp175 [Caulobacter virus Magneto]YP_006989559.1 hypothetical protein CcrKarma_gp179 [Caulobacter virus Karma]YP_006989907.1 hypothetical protein D870_gp247 [Caulobacter phage CcrSwift]ARB14391.1 hypothetical protein Ccr5_gp171c [Caulobacter phage Ccr5]ARB15090.1 hypothetical protein Ccr32_gp172 [Caulobacter phage Ccr32]ARB15424.1 hypothetical protein Ccr34_gp182 [Caulobacter phage Ccr34